jgi:hypothetical protein
MSAPPQGPVRIARSGRRRREGKTSTSIPAYAAGTVSCEKLGANLDFDPRTRASSERLPHRTIPGEHYAHRLRALGGSDQVGYETWNEPNMSLFWRPESGAPARYAALNRAAWRGIHGIDPRCRVVVGGFTTYVPDSTPSPTS